MKAISQTFLTAVLMLTIGCAESDPLQRYEERDARVANALANNDDFSPFSSNAVWLVYTSSTAPNDRLAVFFGYPDNLAACQELVGILEEQYPNRTHHCDLID